MEWISGPSHKILAIQLTKARAETRGGKKQPQSTKRLMTKESKQKEVSKKNRLQVRRTRKEREREQK